MEALGAVESRPCKICGAPAPLFGVVDFNKSCPDPDLSRGRPSGIPVTYHRCGECGFLFTAHCDAWSQAEFSERIYNADYVKVDPDYLGARPTRLADMVISLFGEGERGALAAVDVGGGEGLLADRLKAAGFAKAVTYDPFVPGHDTPPRGTFNVVCCFEVLEHVCDPRALVHSWTRLMGAQSLAIFGTLLVPENIEQEGLKWWYAAPRNGHISLQSARSLRLLLNQEGLGVASLNSGIHVACRRVPKFASRFLS